MDGVWLILDALSFDSTPFSPGGPETMPEFERLTRDRGVLFDSAYSPGPFSPSAHASFFTGALPSETGMYEAKPRFDSDLQTIAGALADTHTTHLISTNMFLFQGLHEQFDHTNDLSRQYLLYREATDPMNYSAAYNDDPRWKRYLDLLISEGKPVRSALNFLSYRLGNDNVLQSLPENVDEDREYQYVNTINDEIERALDTEGDSFVIANYMDLHAPLDVSDRALDRFFSDTPRERIPLRTAMERHRLADEKSSDPALMERLYHAALWEFDRQFTPFVERLLDDNTFVAVLADHGSWDNNSAYSDERLHVPLMLFAPDETARTVSHTVNLRSLPRTTMEQLRGESGGFEEADLFSVTENQISISEIIHSPNEIYEKTERVYVNRPTKPAAREAIQHDAVVIEDGSKVTIIDDEVTVVREGDADIEELKRIARNVVAGPLDTHNEVTTEIDDVTKERLEHFGYLE
jgi:arylsulfatase A-like enzyme